MRMTGRSIAAACVAAACLAAAVWTVWTPSAARAQVGPQLLITMNLAGPAKTEGADYFIAFRVSDDLLLGPLADSTNWTHYVLYRDGRFFFGTVPAEPFRPFQFLTIRPPQPYLYGNAVSGGRALVVRVALSDLGVTLGPATRIKVNFVTTDEYLKPVDALGRGPGDQFGFVTLDLSRQRFLTIPHAVPRSCDDPSLCIAGGALRMTTP